MCIKFLNLLHGKIKSTLINIGFVVVKEFQLGIYWFHKQVLCDSQWNGQLPQLVNDSAGLFQAQVQR